MRSPPQDEISHTVNVVSPQEDNLVDRLQVEAWQHVQLSSTNRTRAFPINDSSIHSNSNRDSTGQSNDHLCSIQGNEPDPKRIPWWFSDRKTPVPIPNTAEKTARSDNTRTVRSRKDSSLPRVYLTKSTALDVVLFCLCFVMNITNLSYFNF